MKKLLTLIILSLMVSLIFVYVKLFSYHPQIEANANKSKFKKSDKEVEIISNNSKGLWGKDKQIKLVEDLSIGKKDGDESEIFGYIYDITIDGYNNIYVTDSYAYTIKVYNNQGKFIKKIGRKGKGPGEFVCMDDTHWCEFDNLLYVVDRKNQRISQFSLDGTYIKGIRTNEFQMRVKRISSFENGHFALAGYVIGRNKITQKIIVVDHSFKNIMSEIQVEFPMHSIGMKVTPSFSDFGVINGNQLYYTSPSDYEIVICDINLNKSKIIRKSSPKMFPAQYVPGFSASFNDVKPILKINDIYLVGVSYQDKKDIPIFKKKMDFVHFYDKLNFMYQLDLFNKEFKFLTSHIIPSNRWLACIDNQNRIYFIEKDPFPRVIRCKLLIE